MVSQRKITDLQAFEIEMADDAGIGPKAAHELASRQVGGPLNLSYTLRDHKNYLRSKRQRKMGYGQAGSMLKYFQDKIAENPSFQYALQIWMLYFAAGICLTNFSIWHSEQQTFQNAPC